MYEAKTYVMLAASIDIHVIIVLKRLER